MKMINKWIDNIDVFFAYIAAATLSFMMVFISLDVFLRFFFKSPMQGTLEITGEYLMVIVVFLGIGYTLKEDSHVTVDFMEPFIPSMLEKPLKILTSLLAIIVLVVMSYSNLIKSFEYLEKNIVSKSLLDYPLAPALIIIAVGLFIMAVRLLITIINILTKRKPQDTTG